MDTDEVITAVIFAVFGGTARIRHKASHQKFQHCFKKTSRAFGPGTTKPLRTPLCAPFVVDRELEAGIGRKQFGDLP